MKDWFYDRVVRRNERIQREYERYVQGHIGEHRKKRWKHWLVLLLLSVKYRDSQKDRVHSLVLVKLKEGTAKLRMEWVPGAVWYNLYMSLDGVHYRFVEKSSRHVCRVQGLEEDKMYFFRFKVSMDGRYYSGFSEVLTVTALKNKELYLMERIAGKEAGDGTGRSGPLPGSPAAGRDKGREDSPALSACQGENGGILLTWEKIPGAIHYNLYRSGEDSSWRFAVQTEENRHLDSQVKGGVSYVYKLKYTFDGKRYHDLPEQAAAEAPREKYPNANSGRLWEGGAESEALGRPLPVHLAKSMMPYDVLSFDVFDTLILRPFAEPSDLFILVGEELGIMDFCEIRKKAEEDARRKSEFLRGTREVTLYDIYEMVEEETGVDAVKGARTEFLTERKLCFANPYMLEVFRMVKARGKTLVAVSDMYLPRELLEELLRSCGYEGFSHVFVSCDYSCTKRKGGLFDILRREYSGQILHVGDHPRSDVEAARERGIEAVQYRNVNEAGKPFRAGDMSRLAGSAYRGIVNAKLHNGRDRYTPWYEVGYVYTGLYCMGFCRWIMEYARARGLEKILFLAREGDLYQKVFRQMYPEFPTAYVLWSRIPVVKTTVNTNRHPYLLQIIHHKAGALYKSRLGVLFERVGIGRLKKYFPAYRLREEEYLTGENEKAVRRLVTEHWDELAGCYDKDQAYIEAYLRRQIGDARRAAVVDVGWSGNNVLQVRRLAETYGMDCEIHCLLAAARNVNDTYMAGMMQRRQVEVYLFSPLQNKGLHDSHQEENSRLNSFFFEILTQSATPTFLGFDSRGRFLYDIPEVENYERDRQIHQGTLDFVKDYTGTFRDFPYMLDISGHDAYMPFQYFSRNLLWIKKYFGDYIFGRDLFATQDKAVMESVKEVMEKAGLWEERQ